MSALAAVEATSKTSRVAHNLTNIAPAKSGCRPGVLKPTIPKNEKTGGCDANPNHADCYAYLTPTSERHSAVSVYAGKEFAGLIGLTHASPLKPPEDMIVQDMGRSAAKVR